MYLLNREYCLSCTVYIGDIGTSLIEINEGMSEIKTHNSELRGQEEAGCTRRTSELFTRSTTVKFVDVLNKPPLKLSLSYLGLSTL